MKMRKELLKINDLNYIHSQEGKLENISLFILAGECVAERKRYRKGDL